MLPILRQVPGLETLPKDSRKILNTRKFKETNNLVTIDPGLYFHFGLTSAIQKHFLKYSICNVDVLKIVVGIDGLPISKSSSSQLWPILGYIRPYSDSVFPIGIYWGYEKPCNSNKYLEQFVLEAKHLIINGITDTKGITVKVEIDGFSMDSPAKSFILKVKGHAGFDSCTRCLEEGEYLKNRTCFPLTSNSSVKRSHDDYIKKKHEEHHVGNAISILSEIPQLDLVYSIGLDYMHLTCLGVMKKLMQLWIEKGSVNVRLPSLATKQISSLLLSLRPHIPCEFARKPRALSELPRFKATELRQIMVYTGQIVFKPFLKKHCFNHFMIFNIAMVILLSINMNDYIDYARDLMIYFVKQFEIIYGKHLVSHNVHGLIHIADDYERFGPLDNISAFPFENFMKTLKKKLRKHEMPLQQLIKRFHEEFNLSEVNKIINSPEEIHFKKVHLNGPLLDDLTGPQYSTIYLRKLNITIKITNVADRFVLTNSNDIIEVVNIAHTKNTNTTVLVGKKFLTKSPYYEQPICSTILNIYKVEHLSNTLYTVFIKDIKNKMMLLETLDKQKVAIPIMHIAKY